MGNLTGPCRAFFVLSGSCIIASNALQLIHYPGNAVLRALFGAFSMHFTTNARAGSASSPLVFDFWEEARKDALKASLL